jgi:atrophin-1 interacting protein 3 (BAI1-associated protein 1)
MEYKYIDILVELHRQENGFGFRIVGGEEEGSQVNVGYIVPNGSADLDGRLKVHDEILMIDNENVVNASHKRVVRLMTIAGLNRRVKLWVRRRVPITVSTVMQQIGTF